MKELIHCRCIGSDLTVLPAPPRPPAYCRDLLEDTLTAKGALGGSSPRGGGGGVDLLGSPASATATAVGTPSLAPLGTQPSPSGAGGGSGSESGTPHLEGGGGDRGSSSLPPSGYSSMAAEVGSLDGGTPRTLNSKSR